MVKCFIGWLLCVCGSLLSPPMVSAQAADAKGDALVNEVRKEYPPALQRLETVYSHMRIVGTAADRFPSLESEYVYGVEVLVSEDSIRLVQTRAAPAVKTVGNTWTYVWKPGLAFWLERKRDAREFAIRSLEAGPGRSDSLFRAVEHKTQLCFAPFSIGVVRLSALVNSPAFKIRDVSWVERAEENLLNVVFDAESKLGIRRTGSILVDPTHAWVIREWRETRHLQPIPTDGHGVIEYDGQYKGVPLLSRAEVTWAAGEPSETREFYELVVEDIRREDIGPEEFTLAAFGVSEAGGARPSSLPPIFTWSLIVATIAFALVLLWRARNRRTPSE